MKDSVGFFLRLVGVMAQHPSQFLEVRVSQRRNARRRGRGDGRAQEMEIMKGPLDALEDMPRNAPKKVVSEAIVSTEKASSDRTIIPARRGHGVGEITFKRKARDGGDKDAPSVSPAREGDSGSSKHSSEIAA